MSRKETDSEQEVAAKWRKVKKVKAAYDNGVLTAEDAKSSPPTAGRDAAAARNRRSDQK